MFKIKLFRSMFLVIVGIAGICRPAAADIVNVDLGSAMTGTLITAIGASFAQTFVGQGISGTAVTGSPTDPLALLPSGTLNIELWNGANSILPQPYNQGPLSVLLDSNADSVTWTMGYADSAGPISIDFFSASGTLVHTVSQTLTSGYAAYTLSGFGDFRGFTFFNDNDPAGLRFENFSYDAVTAPVPEPSASLLLILALTPAVFTLCRRRFV